MNLMINIKLEGYESIIVDLCENISTINNV